MGQCVKCRCMLPPQLMTDVSPTEKMCLFCEVDKKEITYGQGKVAVKEQVVKDYDVFLKIVKEKNQILKDAMKGDTKNIPKSILDE